MVVKKDGTIRFCVDYRPLNALTRRDKYPLPIIDEIVDKAGRRKYYSHLDLLKGYWQFMLSVEASAKTAFLTPDGLYEFVVMPFGLTNAPAMFQRVMDAVLDGLDRDKVFVYLDDIITVTDTWEEHLELLEQVFQRLEAYGMVIKLEKCELGVEESILLGYKVDGDGIHVDPKKVDAIQKVPLPRTVRELVSFINMAGWYRRFIPRYAAVTYPLRRIMKNAANRQAARRAMRMPLEWDEESKVAFEEVKAVLTSAPVLVTPDYNKEFYLAVDASKKGFGAVLCQFGQDQKEHPIGYYSRSTTDTESRYSAVDLEATACEWALERTRMYHEGRLVVVLSDHQALKHLMTTDNAIKSRRLQQLYIKMQAFNTKWKYRPGQQQKVADHLSRYPMGQEMERGVGTENAQDASAMSREDTDTTMDVTGQPDDPEFNEEECERLIEVFTVETAVSPDEEPHSTGEGARRSTAMDEAVDIRRWQRQDQQVSELVQLLISGEGLTGRVISRKDLDNFVVLDGVLYHREDKGTQLQQVIPRGLSAVCDGVGT